MNNILIVGTGALATLFAARLAESRHHVTMLGTWKDGLDALSKNGARLVDDGGVCDLDGGSCQRADLCVVESAIGTGFAGAL